MSRLSGCGGILIGVLIILLSIAYIVLAPQAQALLEQVPLVGDWLADVFRQVLYFPNAQYICPLFALVSIAWGVALLMKRSWARVMGFVFLALAGVYVLSLLLVVAPLEELRAVRWWVVAFGLAIAALLFVIAVKLLSKDARESFAQAYLDTKDVDQVAIADARAGTSTGAAPPPAKKADQPELARLVPVDSKAAPFLMRQPSITIGREGTDLQFDPSDTSLSRKHAEISYVGGQFYLEDLSQNGTKVNGQLVKRSKVPLPDGATIEMGRQGAYTFRHAAQPTPPPNRPATAQAPATAMLNVGSKTAPIAPEMTNQVAGGARLEALWPGGPTYSLVKPMTTIGRNPDLDLALPGDADLTVSGRHAEIEHTGQGAYVLRDLGSTNGTYVDNQRISAEVELKESMEIRFGTRETRFKFRQA